MGAVVGGALVALLGLTLQAELGAVKLADKLTAYGGLLTGLSALAAFLLYWATVRRHRQEDSQKASKAYLDETVRGMERAYETFIRLGANPPKNDRLLWLSTARMLIRSQRLST